MKRKKQLASAIEEIHRILKGKEIRWRFGGSTNMLLYGINVDAHDIDIITDKKGAYNIGKLFKKYEIVTVRFSENDKFSSYFGKFRIKNIDIDVMGDLKIKVKGIWVNSYLGSIAKKVKINGNNLILPLFELDSQLRSYKLLNRKKDKEKIKLIIDFMKLNNKSLHKSGILSASYITLYDSKKRVLIQHRTNDAPTSPGYWGLFGGGVEIGEDHFDAVKRECFEELEYKLKKPFLVIEDNVIWKSGKAKNLFYIEKYDGKQKLVLHEGQGKKWIKIDDIKKMKAKRYVKDALMKIKEKIK